MTTAPAARSSSPAPCPTPTAPCTSATWSSPCRPTSGCASSACAATTASTSAPSDAHGTPIMLKARQEGITPEALVERVGAEHAARLRRLRHRARQLPHHALAGEPRADASAIYRRLRRRAATSRRETIRQAYDEQARMFLPDRFVRGTCPRCGAADQYGDTCEICGATYTPGGPHRPGVGGHRHAAGAARLRAPVLQARRLRADACASGPAPARLQPAVAAKLDEWFERRPAATGTSRATRPTSASRFPARPASTSTSGSTRRSATSAASAATAAASGLDFDALLEAGQRRRAPPLHRQGHRATSTRCSGRRCCTARATAAPTGVLRARLPDRRTARRCRSRAAPSSPRARYLDHLPPEYLRYYFAREARARRRRHRPEPRGLRRARELRPRRQARQHREPLRRLHRARFGGRLADAAAGARAVRRVRRRGRAASPRRTRPATIAARVREIMALADRANQYIDQQKPWVLAKDPARPPRCRRVCTQGINLFRAADDLSQAGRAAARRRRRALPRAWRTSAGTTCAQPLLGHAIGTYEPLATRVDPPRPRRCSAPLPRA